MEKTPTKSSFLSGAFIGRPSVSNAVQLQGKELSYNNILDIDSAMKRSRV